MNPGNFIGDHLILNFIVLNQFSEKVLRSVFTIASHEQQGFNPFVFLKNINKIPKLNVAHPKI